MKYYVNKKNISIVLNKPRFPENIGACVRAMRNMGFKHLIVAKPENFDIDKVSKMATHVASNIVKNIKIFSNLKEALAPFSYVVGTTSRLGKHRHIIKSVSKLAESLVVLSMENNVAILFGPEDKGLSNDDLRYCHALVNIPTEEFSSLNLAQAVMIICYEIFLANKEIAEEEFIPKLAQRHELDGMYEQLKDIMQKISYINDENPYFCIDHLRQFLTRMQLCSREVKIIRGICRQIDWYGSKCYKEGLEK